MGEGGAPAREAARESMSACAGRAPGECLGRAGPVHGGGGQQRAAGHRGERPAGRRLFQQGKVSLTGQRLPSRTGQQLLLGKGLHGPVPLGGDNGVCDGSWWGDRVLQSVAFQLWCMGCCARSGLCSQSSGSAQRIEKSLCA